MEPRRWTHPLWRFTFHHAPGNLAETLTFGRERADLDNFYDRAGFEVYRAFDQDARDNRSALKAQGRLRMPVLALAGEHSVLAPATEPMINEVAKHATVRTIPKAGHWIAEENPGAVVEALVGFLKGQAS